MPTICFCQRRTIPASEVAPRCPAWQTITTLIERTVKSAITSCILSLLLLPACSHLERGRRSTEEEIYQHITGEWTLDDQSDGLRFQQVAIVSDGSFIGVQSNGLRALVGTWTLDHRILVVNLPSQTNYATFTDGTTISLGTVTYYPIIFASEHELVCTPGISMTGRLRFTK